MESVQISWRHDKEFDSDIPAAPLGRRRWAHHSHTYLMTTKKTRSQISVFDRPRTVWSGARSPDDLVTRLTTSGNNLALEVNTERQAETRRFRYVAGSDRWISWEYLSGKRWVVIQLTHWLAGRVWWPFWDRIMRAIVMQWIYSSWSKVRSPGWLTGVNVSQGRTRGDCGTYIIDLPICLQYTINDSPT